MAKPGRGTPFLRIRSDLISKAMDKLHGGVSVLTLARLCGIPRGRLSHLINGQYHGNAEDLVKIAGVLGLDPTKLIAIDLKPPTTTEDQERHDKLVGITKDHATILRLWDLLQGDPDHAERWRQAVDADWSLRCAGKVRTNEVVHQVRMRQASDRTVTSV